MDIAQAAFGVYMFNEAGTYDGGVVDGIDPEKFTSWMVCTYTAISYFAPYNV